MSPCDTVASMPVVYWYTGAWCASSILRRWLTHTSMCVTAERYRPHELWSGTESIIGAPSASPASMRMRARLREPARMTRRSAAGPGPVVGSSVSSASLRLVPFLSADMSRAWKVVPAWPAPALHTRYVVQWHRFMPLSDGSGRLECSAQKRPTKQLGPSKPAVHSTLSRSLSSPSSAGPVSRSGSRHSLGMASRSRASAACRAAGSEMSLSTHLPLTRTALVPAPHALEKICVGTCGSRASMRKVTFL